MTWVRFAIWDRWGELTRFRLGCEMSLSAYHTYLTSVPFVSTNDITIRDPSGESNFRCDYSELVRVLSSSEQLYRILLPAYTGLIEEFARNLLEELIDQRRVARSNFNGMDTNIITEDAVSNYVRNNSVEVWGQAILTVTNRNWSNIQGGKFMVVKAFVVRNIIAHGLLSFNQKSINRLSNTQSSAIIPSVGDPISLTKKAFQEYLSTLRAFGRCLADGVANYP